jgi:hypothetical protein
MHAIATVALRGGVLGLLLFAGLVLLPAHAQDVPQDPSQINVNVPDVQLTPGSNRSALSKDVRGPRSSPFTPTESDRKFVVDSGSGLDTGCTFKTGSPLVFDVEITRYVGPVDSEGYLLNPDELVQNGVVSKEATLTMPAFDIDDDAQVGEDIAPEIDAVSLNGTSLGFLKGQNNTWILNSYRIPISRIKFPERAPLGSTPKPRKNRIRIDIDVENDDPVWCTSVDWASIEFKTMSPIILVHGNQSAPEFWDKLRFVAPLLKAKLPFEGCKSACTYPVKLPTDTTAENARRLAQLIPPIVRTFGADSYHIVAHSKGGLDSREYLAVYEPDDIEALSYTSLSTPHNGSVLADYQVLRREYAAASFILEGFPAGLDGLIFFLPARGGASSITTSSTAAFNTQNIPLLSKRGTSFFTIGADADINQNKTIQADEYDGLRVESEQLQRFYFTRFPNITNRIATIGYRTLFFTESIEYDVIRLPGLGARRGEAVRVFSEESDKFFFPNDIFVTLFSAVGRNSFETLVRDREALTGVEGRDHADIADDGTARDVVLPWIFEVEDKSGDFPGRSAVPIP